MGVKSLIRDLKLYGCDRACSSTQSTIIDSDASKYNIFIDAQSLVYKFAMSYEMVRNTSYQMSDHCRILKLYMARSIYNIVVNTVIGGSGMFQNGLHHNRFPNVVVVFDGDAPKRKLLEQNHRAPKSFAVQLLLKYFTSNSLQVFQHMCTLLEGKFKMFKYVTNIHFYKCEQNEGEFASVYMHVPSCPLGECNCFTFKRICISYDTDLLILGALNVEYIESTILILPKSVITLANFQLIEYRSLLVTLALLRGNDFLPSIYSGNKLKLIIVNKLRLKVETILLVVLSPEPKSKIDIQLFKHLLDFLIEFFDYVLHGECDLKCAKRGFIVSDDDRRQFKLWLIDFIFDATWYIRYITNRDFSNIDGRRTAIIKSPIFKRVHMSDILQMCHSFSNDEINSLIYPSL